MALPASARRRLAASLSRELDRKGELGKWHTLPVDKSAWAEHVSILQSAASAFVGEIEAHPATVSDYRHTQRWLERVIETRARVWSLTLSLRPFRPFDEKQARRLLNSTDRVAVALVDSIESGVPVDISVADVVRASEAWTTDAGLDRDRLLPEAFGVEEDLTDEGGEFMAARVFRAYRYDNVSLMVQLLPHLRSIGVLSLTDTLASVSIVGWILAAQDQIFAYSSMDALLRRLFSSDPVTVRLALEHLKHREAALRQGRIRINRALAGSSSANDEERALILAEIYRRLIEGPVRQYGWMFHSLDRGSWSDPPMLTELRNTLIARGGWIKICGDIILSDLRNGEAHETLEWDGVGEVYRAEGAVFDRHLVGTAAMLADSFARGCAAAIACYNALHLVAGHLSPSVDDPGRISARDRAEAFFGTNGLWLVKAEFNAATAKVHLKQLEESDINPCFQALLCARALLPNVERFQVLTEVAEEPVLSISAKALDITMPVWTLAATRFDSMPFSAFLPANLHCRAVIESPSAAIRSAAWIATDDILDAIDGTPAPWKSSELDLVRARLAVARLAIAQCLVDPPPGPLFRLTALGPIVEMLEADLAAASLPLSAAAVDDFPSTRRLRDYWNAWGPVPRLPGVERGQAAKAINAESRPGLRQLPEDLRWGSI